MRSSMIHSNRFDRKAGTCVMKTKTKASAQLDRPSLRGRAFHLLALVAVILGPASLSGQTVPATPSTSVETPASASSVGEDYKIGPGDVLTISVTDTPEYGGKFRVADSGVIQVTGVNDPLMAEGLTPIELSLAIRKALVDAKQLRNPKVNVFVDEYHGRTITILGAVSKPSVYSLSRHTTVLEALSLAGGALPNSGSTITVVRGAASAEATNTPIGSVQIIDVAQLTHGDNLSGNIEVRNGDVLNVSPAQIVYVVGAVAKPGGFVLANPSDGVSVVQAVALAEGFKPLASTHHGLIIRQSTSAQARREIPVDLQDIMNGKETDLVLAPNDILYVPESTGKKVLKVMGEVAMAAVNGVAIYGLGYRIGTSTF